MWNPTTTSSDNKKQVELDDCKCSGGNDDAVAAASAGLNDQKQQQQQLEFDQQTNNSKYPQQQQQTSLFGAQLTGSAEENPTSSSYSANQEENKLKFLEETQAETTDSGFISGPQIISSENIVETTSDEEGVRALPTTTTPSDKILNIPTSQDQQQQQQPPHKLQESNLDSGCIELEEELESSDQLSTASSGGNNMRLKYNVDASLDERFGNLQIKSSNLNDLNAPRQRGDSCNPSSSGTTAKLVKTAPTQQQQQQQQQTTYSNQWEKYYEQNEEGDTPLHLACISGFEDVVAALIRMAPHPCLFNIQNYDAHTPLHLATLTAQPKLIRMLLIAGAEPTIRDSRGNTALHLACLSNAEQCVQALTIPISASEVNEAHRKYGHRINDKSYLKYAHLPSDLEIRNYDGERCVHLAAQAGLINILRILVTFGADINAREGKSGRTPLHIAIECCDEALANFLLDECQPKLNLETATYAGLTAYQVACILNKSEMQNMLEKRGAEPLTPPDSDYDSSDIEDLDDSKFYAFGDPGYFLGYSSANIMAVN